MRQGLVLVFALMSSALWAQSDEELFGAPPPDVTVGDGGKVDLSPILAPAGPSLHGSLVSSGVVFVGQDPDRRWTKGFGYDFASSLSFDARPDASLHWSATLQSSLPAGATNWSAPTIGAMYVDYTLLQSVFFTVGRFSGSWGVGRLFSVNDLLAPLDGGVALKAFAPLGPIGITVVTLAPPGATQLGALGWVGQAQLTQGAWNLAVAGQRIASAGSKFDASVKTAAWGADWFGEVKATLPGGEPVVSALAGFYWEGFDPKLGVQAEWMIDGASPGWQDQSVALALGWSVIPRWGLKPSAKVTWAWLDGSGQVLVGLEAEPFAHVHFTLGLPYSWGAANSRWVTNTVTSYRVARAVALKVDLTAQF